MLGTWALWHGPYGVRHRPKLPDVADDELCPTRGRRALPDTRERSLYLGSDAGAVTLWGDGPLRREPGAAGADEFREYLGLVEPKLPD